jgi:hypothetical protein
VWAVIFSSFAVPEEYRYHVLLWGVMGALLAAEIYARLAGVGRAADVVVVTPEDIERFGDSPALIIEPAPREGKVVYAASPNRYPPDDPREWLNRARFSTRRHRRLSPWPLL